jgi:hypothetical protein
MVVLRHIHAGKRLKSPSAVPTFFSIVWPEA